VYEPGNYDIRIARIEDVPAILYLYQLSVDDIYKDGLFLDHRKLKNTINNKGFQFMVAHSDGKPSGVVLSSLDLDQRATKIIRIYVDPSLPDCREVKKSLIKNVIEVNRSTMDVVFMTTKHVTLDQLQLSKELGFHFLGFFPISARERVRNPAALTAFFYDGIVEKIRLHNQRLHPLVMPLYNVVNQKMKLSETQCEPEILPAMKSASTDAFDPMDLELIEAPKFVLRKFKRLKEKNLLSTDFYPFQEPNALITDPEGKFEVFVMLNYDLHFSAIIEERLELPVNPAVLYRQIARILHERNITYIEMIVDAADGVCIEYMLQAGFIPIMYFPCLKKHGDVRRDFVILGHTYEKLIFCLDGLRDKYPEMIKMYAELDKMILQRNNE